MAHEMELANAGWPNFRYDGASLIPLSQKFLQSAGEVIGAVRHFDEDDSNQLRIGLLSDEAVRSRGSFLTAQVSNHRSARSSGAASMIGRSAPRTGYRRDDGICVSELA